jgi:hypothetical protein
MCATRKKEAESYFLNEFLKLHPGLNVDSVECSEEPDFLCHSSGRSIGIEVTRFFFSSSGALPPQALSRYRREFGQRLRTNHAGAGLPPVTVSVHMLNDTNMTTKSGRIALEIALFDFVGRNIPPEGPHVSFDWNNLSEKLRGLGVHAISILRHPSLTKPFWSLSEGSFVPESKSPFIQAILDKKNPLVPRYRKKASEIWLLVVSGSEGLHSILDFDHDILTATYKSAFDRLFVFRTFGRATHELKVSSVP